MRRSSVLAVVAVFVGVLLLAAGTARAFCGFYVGGADAKLYNNATLVVLMRQGTRTVLSMQNNYQGPPEGFAMVVPVPVVLQKDNVRTLKKEVFAKIDQLASPRLVEYWEQDPCAPPEVDKSSVRYRYEEAPRSVAASGGGRDLGVKIEAQFTVAEYEIVILSAKDSTGLDTWLKREGYKIPDGAEPILRPYVQKGMKFFVAKVDPKKVTFANGQAMLSPLRFHYDTEEFALPVRLGLVNSAGTQDLIVHILARGQRYEVANYPNVTIPTNIDVAEDLRGRFGAFYAALFDATVEKNPKAVVTEYAWDAGSCDPCPTPPLEDGDLATLGLDVLPGKDPYGFVVTRLHARYRKDVLGEDLVFRAAPPISGGREVMSEGGKLEHGSRPDGVNNFQGRYAIRHPWTGPIACQEPHRGVWGGPPQGVTAPAGPTAALGLAFAPRGQVKLPEVVRQDVPELGIKPAPTAKPVASPSAPPAAGGESKKSSGCALGGGARGDAFAGAAAAMTLALAMLLSRRRR